MLVSFPSSCIVFPCDRLQAFGGGGVRLSQAIFKAFPGTTPRSTLPTGLYSLVLSKSLGPQLIVFGYLSSLAPWACKTYARYFELSIPISQGWFPTQWEGGITGDTQGTQTFCMHSSCFSSEPSTYPLSGMEAGLDHAQQCSPLVWCSGSNYARQEP